MKIYTFSLDDEMVRQISKLAYDTMLTSAREYALLLDAGTCAENLTRITQLEQTAESTRSILSAVNGMCPVVWEQAWDTALKQAIPVRRLDIGLMRVPGAAGRA